jgi:hypothetical protein
MSTEKRPGKESRLMIVGDYQQIYPPQGSERDRIIVALDERRGKLPIEQLLFCRLKGIQVDDGMAFTEELAGKLSVEHLYPSSLIFSNGYIKSAFFKKVKRYFDVVASAAGLILSFPFCLLIGLAIKLDSRGPVCTGRRVGEDGKTFDLLKFRSMHIDAEKTVPSGPSPTIKRNPGRPHDSKVEAGRNSTDDQCLTG